MFISCWSKLLHLKALKLRNVGHFSFQKLTFKERLTLSRRLQFERHKKFVGDYILYYGGQMADFKRSV